LPDLSALQDFADEEPGFDLLDEDEPAPAHETAPIDVREPAVPVRRQPTAAPARTGESFQSMKSRLGKWDALTPFANQQGQIYARNRLAGTCPCGNTDDPGVCSARWKGKLATISLHWGSLITIFFGGILTQRRFLSAEFISYHPLCNKCYRRHRIMKLVAVGLRLGAIIAGLIAVFLLSAAFILFVVPPVSIGCGSISVMIGLAFCIASVAGWIWATKLRVPPSMRHVGEGPFRLKKITVIG